MSVRTSQKFNMEKYILYHQQIDICMYTIYHVMKDIWKITHQRNLKWFAMIRCSGNIHLCVNVGIQGYEGFLRYCKCMATVTGLLTCTFDSPYDWGIHFKGFGKFAPAQIQFPSAQTSHYRLHWPPAQNSYMFVQWIQILCGVTFMQIFHELLVRSM